MCFYKNNRPKLVLFLPPALEIIDQDLEPSEKLSSQIKEQVWPGHEDEVVLAPDQVLVLRTRSWSVKSSAKMPVGGVWSFILILTNYDGVTQSFSKSAIC